jgi:hypothetical protein
MKHPLPTSGTVVLTHDDRTSLPDLLDHDDDPCLLDRVDARGSRTRPRFRSSSMVWSPAYHHAVVSIASWMTAATT